jgi:hypothetical protein
VEAIWEYVRAKGVLREWSSFSGVYERETVHDFLSLTEELVVFVGLAYLKGVLKEAV